jgi:hypothetical protein
MSIKNPKELLIAATALPAAIEAKLPTGAPKVSVTLTDIANKMPVFPDFPMALPDLPAVPTLPAMPAGAGLGRRNYVAGVEVTPVRALAPKPAVPTGKIPLVFE